MIRVDAIENPEDLALMYKFLIKHSHTREAHLLIIGCNVALRISDLLKLTFDQLEKSNTYLVEQKTGKGKELLFNSHVKDHVKKLKEWYASNDIKPTYLFQSTSPRAKGITPVSPSWVNRKLSEAGEGAMLDYNVGTHSMRKFWGYNAYKRGTDLSQIQLALNHSSPGTTLAYIGITKKKQDQLYIDNGVGVL